jgi:hypothetical protein
MSKRFIDTNYFNDPFILKLTSEDKLLYIYLTTICDHAGVFEINEELGNFHLKIKNYIDRIENFVKKYPEKIVQLDNKNFILMMFCKRQYPGGANTKVMQIKGAISILNKWKIEVVNNQTFEIRVSNPYEPLRTLDKDYGSGNGIGIGILSKKDNTLIKVCNYTEFYDLQLQLSNNDSEYEYFIKILFGENIYKRPLHSVLKLKEQLSWEQFESIKKIKIEYNILITEILQDMDSWKDLHKNNTLLGTFRTFAKRNYVKKNR